MTELTGKVALVTGGSRGIGAAVALRLAEAGSDVAIGCAAHQEQAGELAEKITQLGRRATVVAGDLGDPDVPGRLVTATTENLGHPDILIANAGTGSKAELADITAQSWDQVLNINLRAPFLLAQAVIPRMREQRYGRIVFMSSVAAFTGGILAAHYTASKAGLIGLAHALAAPLAPHGVTVNAVAPALIETDMLTADPRLQALRDRIPAGRLGRPREIADMVAAIVTNDYLTAQTISVDGGMYPR